MKKNLLLVFTLFFSLFLFAQNGEFVKIEGIQKNGFKGLKSIVNKINNEVYGHYTYYRKDGKLVIDFLDTDLNVKHKLNLEMSANGTIDEGIYNDESMLFLVSEFGKATAYTVSLEGEQIAKTVLSYSAQAKMSVFPSDGDNCYYFILPSYAKKKGGYKAMKVDVNLKTIWEKTFLPEAKRGFISVESAQSGNDRLVIVQRTKPKIFSKKAYGELVCLDDANGDVLFKNPLYDDSFTAMPSQIIIDEEQNIIAAGQFFKGVKERSVASKGVFVKKYSASGEELKINKQTWKEGIQAQLRKTQKKISGKNKVYFHTITQSGDDGYQLIGETFSASKGGAILGELAQSDNDFARLIGMIQTRKSYIAAMVSGRYIGNAAPDKPASTITTQDFIMFDYSSDLELEDVRKVEKDYSKIYVYEPYTYVGGLKLSKVISDYGFFDFAFTGKTSSADEKVIVYNATYTSNPHIGTFAYGKGVTPAVKRINFKELKGDSQKKGKKNKAKGGKAGVAQSIDGKMVIYFYISKDKTNKEIKAEKKAAKKAGKKYSKKSNGALYMYVEDIASGTAVEQVSK